MTPRKAHASLGIAIRGDKDHPLTAELLARVFKGIQDALFVLGTEVEGVPFKENAPIPTRIKKEFALELVDAKPGSLETKFILRRRQLRIDDDRDFTREVLSKLHDTFQVLERLDARRTDLTPIVAPNLRQRRLLEALQQATPADPFFRIETKSESGSHQWSSENNERIRRLIVGEPKPGELLLTGRVTGMTVDRKRIFTMDSAEHGIVHIRYPREGERWVLESLRSLAEVKARLGARGKTYTVSDPTSITRLERLTFGEIRTGKEPVHLQTGLQFQVDIDDNDWYVATNESVNLVASAPTMALLRRDIEHQLRIVWEDYALAKDEELTENAQLIKRFLLEASGR